MWFRKEVRDRKVQQQSIIRTSLLPCGDGQISVFWFFLPLITLNYKTQNVFSHLFVVGAVVVKPQKKELPSKKLCITHDTISALNLYFSEREVKRAS